MNTNQNPEGVQAGRIETTDDVEGHRGGGWRVNPDETGNDVTGHVSSERVNPDEKGNEVDGHGANFRGPTADEDDVEGHRKIGGGR